MTRGESLFVILLIVPSFLLSTKKILNKRYRVDKELIFKALTIIDPVTNLLEIVRIDDKSAQHAATTTDDNNA